MKKFLFSLMILLANSSLGAYNANKEPAEGISHQLGPVTILVYELSKNVKK